MALKRVDGVDEADVSYETGRGEVVFDPARTSPETFIAELQRMTGFVAVLAAERRGPTPAAAERQ